MGSKYLVGLPSGLRIDILSKGSCVSTKCGCLLSSLAEMRMQRRILQAERLLCVCRVGVSERDRGAARGAGVENQNTRSGRSAVRLRRQIRDSATVTTHPKVGPCRCAVAGFSKADWSAPRGGKGHILIPRAVSDARLVRSRMLRPAREHWSETPPALLDGDMQALRKRHRPRMSNLEVS